MEFIFKDVFEYLYEQRGRKHPMWRNGLQTGKLQFLAGVEGAVEWDVPGIKEKGKGVGIKVMKGFMD